MRYSRLMRPVGASRCPAGRAHRALLAALEIVNRTPEAMSGMTTRPAADTNLAITLNRKPRVVRLPNALELTRPSREAVELIRRASLPEDGGATGCPPGRRPTVCRVADTGGIDRARATLCGEGFSSSFSTPSMVLGRSGRLPNLPRRSAANSLSELASSAAVLLENLVIHRGSADKKFRPQLCLATRDIDTHPVDFRGTP